MAVFVVYRQLPALTSANLHAVQRALTEAGRRVTADGAPMQYVRSTYVPSSGQCLCVFQAESSEAVARANEIAQVPFTSIHEALDVSAPDAPIDGCRL
jgi:hypothetical protein